MFVVGRWGVLLVSAFIFKCNCRLQYYNQLRSLKLDPKWMTKQTDKVRTPRQGGMNVVLVSHHRKPPKWIQYTVHNAADAITNSLFRWNSKWFAPTFGMWHFRKQWRCVHTNAHDDNICCRLSLQVGLSSKMALNAEQEAVISQMFEAYISEYHQEDVVKLLAASSDDSHRPVVINAMTLFEANMEVLEPGLKGWLQPKHSESWARSEMMTCLIINSLQPSFKLSTIFFSSYFLTIASLCFYCLCIFLLRICVLLALRLVTISTPIPVMSWQYLIRFCTKQPWSCQGTPLLSLWMDHRKWITASMHVSQVRYPNQCDGLM